MYSKYFSLARRLLSTTFLTGAVTAAALSSSTLLLQAETWTGDGGDNLWSNADNWNNSSVPTTDENASIGGAVNVELIGQGNADHLAVGAEENINSTLTIKGENSVLNVHQFDVGYNGGVGTMIVTDGATVNATVGAVGGTGDNSSIVSDLPPSELLIDGAGSKVIIASDKEAVLFVGGHNEGKVTIANGGSLKTDTMLLGAMNIQVDDGEGGAAESKGTGYLVVDGQGSQLEANNAVIGIMSSGHLTVTNGGQAKFNTFSPDSMSGIYINSSSSGLSNDMGLAVGGLSFELNSDGQLAKAQSDASVLVSGEGSLIEAAGDVNIASYSMMELVKSQGGTPEALEALKDLPTTGIVTLADQGTLKADGDVNLGGIGTHVNIATLNIGQGGSAGILIADKIVGHDGTNTVNFNHQDDYVFDTLMTGKLDINHQNIGTTTLDAVNDYSGETNVSAGILRSGQLGAFSSQSDFQIGVNGILDANGNNEILKSLSNAGVLALNQAGNNVGTILTIEGDYLGEDGTIAFNTALVGDDSATDKLIINGSTSGTTNVLVTNRGGLGAQTTNGIELITVGNDSDGIFNLAGDYEHNGEQAIVAGAYAYQLHQGVVDNPDNGNWYLRSALKNGDSKEPLYQAGVPVYEAYPQLLLGLNSLPTLQQRVGNRYWNNAGNKVLSQGADAIEAYAPAEEAGVVIEENGVWGRIEGAHTKIKSKTSTSGTDYDYNTFKMQAGLDGLLNETENGKLIGGVTVHYAHGKADIYSAHGDGDIKTNGYGFGGTLTWFGENGFYVDNQAQLTWYDSDLNSSTANKSLKHGNNGFGYALSVETGKRITIDENWSVTPQAQFMYSNVRFDSFADTLGAHISKKRADSLQGKIGISADYQNSWLNDQGTINRSNVYGITNLYNEFLNGTKVDVSGVNFTSKRETLWAGVGLGGSYNWNDDKHSIYGEGSVNTSLKNFGDSYSYKGTVGLRVKW